MHPVVQQQRFVRAAGRTGLAVAIGVPDRDRQGDLARVDCRAADRDATLDEGTEHREEAAIRILDLTGVGALGIDLRVAVEQCGAGHADLVENDPAVVDPVQAELRAAVGQGDAGIGSPS